MADMIRLERAEEALRDSEQRYQLLLDALPDPIVMYDLDGLATYINPAFTDTFGWSLNEIIGQRVDFVPPENVPETVEGLKRLFRDDHIDKVETRRFTKDGRTLAIQLSASVLKNTAGQPINTIMSLRDISEWKQAEEALQRTHIELEQRVTERTADLIAANAKLQEQVAAREQAEKTLTEERHLLRTLIDTIPDQVWVKDPQSRFLLGNLATMTILGITAHTDLIGKSDYDFHTKELAEQFIADEQAIIHSGQAQVNKEEAVIDATGQQRWVWSTKILLRDSEGEIMGIVGSNRDVTARKKAEEALAAERALLRALIDNVPDAIYFKDTQGRILIDNIQNRRNMGTEDTIGKSDFDFHPRELAEEFFAVEQEIMRTGEALIDQEEINIDLHGNQGWHLSTRVPLRDAQGKTLGLVGITRDITDRKRAEDTLAAERTLLRTLIDNIPDCIYAKDAKGRFILNNIADARVVSANAMPEDLLGKTDFDFLPQEMAAKFYADEQALIHSGTSQIEQEERLIDQSTGQPIWNQTSKIPLRDHKGNIIGLVGISRDITARKQAEEALKMANDELERRIAERTAELVQANQNLQGEIAERKRAEDEVKTQQTFLRQIIDANPCLIFVKDWDGRFVTANQALATMYRTTVENLIGKTDADFNRDETEVEQYIFADREVIRTGQTKVIAEETIASGEDVTRWFKTIKVPLIPPTGQATQVLGVAMEITERKLAEEALRKQREEQQIILDAIPALIWYKDTKNNILWANKAVADSLGVSREKMVGVSTHDVYPTKADKFYEDDLEVVNSGVSKIGIESRSSSPTGDVWMQTSKVPIFDNAGRTTNIVVIASDITPRKTAEAEREALLASESAARREAQDANRLKDLFLATMSHELRTPLNAMIGFLHLMLFSDQLNEDNIHMAERTLANSQRLLTLINNILDLSRIASGRLEIIPVSMSPKRLAAAIHEDAGIQAKERGLTLEVAVDEALPTTIVHDEERITQIATNLVNNAMKFTESGKISLTFKRHDDRLCIEVIDTGMGIPPSRQQIIFDDFVQLDATTTRKFGGAGLGLSIVKRLTILMGGSVKVVSDVGKGSTFTVELPLQLTSSR